MMLNKFIWNNYKQTNEGQRSIKIFEEGTTRDILTNYSSNLPFDLEITSDIIDELLLYCSYPILPEELDNEIEFWRNLYKNGFTITYPNSESKSFDQKSIDFIQLLPILSLWLYYNYPFIFKPYFFIHKFRLLTKISDSFNLELPKVPLKKNKEERFLYYVELCKAFQKFQTNNELTDAEFCAFLYDFAPKYVSQLESDNSTLPEATQAWWIGGDKSGKDFHFLDNATSESISFWQGNEDTKKGDILVMYCLSPRSFIHSIWRAISDGIADPFFHYYSSIYIGHPQKVPPITIQELKDDPHFSKNPLVRKNLQGINGYPLYLMDYSRLQALIKEKGGEIKNIPQLYSPTFESNTELKNEREVELQLIEPLLEKLGYTNKDWIRQLVVRMGRGERNFPDYAFLLDSTTGFERAYFLIESKYYIKSNRELEDTFKQVWSYGQRLGAEKLMIADKNAIWIYVKKQEIFERTDYKKIFWKELENSDKFRDVKNLIGKF